MKASETKLQRIIEGTNQYVVPLFQRPYSWDTKEWTVLWDDLVELYEEENPRTHFIGSIVTMPTQSVPEGVSKFLLIDGQQRFTTTFLLLAAKRVVVSNLVLVSIVLDPDDNPYLVFESLNAKGRVLSQADLIRNYFFMKIHRDDQEKQYAALWKPMQDKLGEDLTEFIRHFLMKDGGVVKQSEVYFALKDRAEEYPKEIIQYLAEISRYADLYSKLLHPEQEANPTLSKQLKMLNRIEVTTAYASLRGTLGGYAKIGKVFTIESKSPHVVGLLEFGNE